MTPLRALIIDDEPLAHKVVLRYAADVPFLEISGQCYQASEAYAFLEKGGIDLIFLDINMPRLKGLDFLRTLQMPPRIIITSAYEEYALEGYELRVTDYLLKPFRFERFLKAVTAVQHSLAPATGQKNGTPAVLAISAPVEREYLFVKVDKRHLRVHINDIQYLESYGNYVKLWMGEKFILTNSTLAGFASELPANFVQVHKSFLLNKSFIDYIEGASVALRSGKLIPIGKNYRTEVKGWLAR